MGSIQVKRMCRYLWQNRARFTALFLLTVIVVAVVVTLICASDIVLCGIETHADEERQEDGEFTLFVPLSETEILQTEESCGVSLEAHFCFDVSDADKTVRAMRMREKIDCLTLCEGSRPQADGEVVLEQIFCREAGYAVGERIRIGEKDYIVCGFGSIPDYGLPLSQLTDLTAYLDRFTWAIFSDSDYDALLAETGKTEEYLYAYRLTEATDANALRQAIARLDPDYSSYANSHPGFEAFLKDRLSAYKIKFGLDPEKSLHASLSSYNESVSDGAEELNRQLAEFVELLTPYEETLKNGKKLGSSSRAKLKAILHTDAQEISQAVSRLSAYLDLLTEIELLDSEQEGGEAVLLSLKLKQEATALSGLSASCSVGFPADAAQQKQLVQTAWKAAQTVQNLIADRNLLFDGVQTVLDGSLTDENAEIRLALRRYIAKQSTFVEESANPRMNDYVDYAYLYRNAGYLCGALLLGLLSMIFAVMTAHQIKREASVIGTQLALGVGRKTLIAFYLFPTLLVSGLGGAVGVLLGYSPWISSLPVSAFHIINSFPYYEKVVSPLLVLYAILAPIATGLVIHLAVLRRALSKTVLELLRGMPRELPAAKGGEWKFLSFPIRFCLRQIRREWSVIFIVIAGISMSLVLLMMGLNTRFITINARQKTQTEMGYQTICFLRYPTSALDCKGGERIYVESLSTMAYGYENSVTVIGISSDSTHFEARPSNASSRTVISRALSEKTGLQAGDTLKLSDGITGRGYTFFIEDVVSSGIGLECYLDASVMCKTFGQAQGYYNAVVSNEPLEMDPAAVLSVGTQADLMSSFEYEDRATLPFTLFSLIGSFLLFLTVLYLVLGMMLDRNAHGISLLKIFGFRPGEIERMYVLGVVFLSFVSIAVAIPLSKILANVFCRYVYFRMEIGTFYTYPLALYFVLFALFALCTGLILLPLLFKVRRTDYSVVLKE